MSSVSICTLGTIFETRGGPRYTFFVGVLAETGSAESIERNFNEANGQDKLRGPPCSSRLARHKRLSPSVSVELRSSGNRAIANKIQMGFYVGQSVQDVLWSSWTSLLFDERSDKPDARHTGTRIGTYLLDVSTSNQEDCTAMLFTLTASLKLRICFPCLVRKN